MVLSEQSREPNVLDVIGGRYQILCPIADGGMGSVFLARQIEVGRQVAIKTMRAAESSTPDSVARFRREAEAVKKLTHPNTIRLYDLGETDEGTLYLVMEYLDGLTLNAVLSSVGPLPLDEVTQIGLQVLKSLVEAHAHGIVHRDIKPSNVMLCDQLGEQMFVKVLDFGLARLDITASRFKTRTGASLGTPHYMSPEQVRGDPLDGRSDLYSLAMTLFELATGEPAYDGATLYEVALEHLKPTLLNLPPMLAGTRLGAVIGRAARKRPEDRFQTVEAMLEALTGSSKSVQPSLLDRAGHKSLNLDEIQAATAVPAGTATQDLSGMVRAVRSARLQRWLAVAAVAVVLVVALIVVSLRPSVVDGDRDGEVVDGELPDSVDTVARGQPAASRAAPHAPLREGDSTTSGSGDETPVATDALAESEPTGPPVEAAIDGRPSVSEEADRPVEAEAPAPSAGDRRQTETEAEAEAEHETDSARDRRRRSERRERGEEPRRDRPPPEAEPPEPQRSEFAIPVDF